MVGKQQEIWRASPPSGLRGRGKIEFHDENSSYGDYAYRSMLTVAAKELDFTEENAAAFLVENYSEAI